MSHLRIIAVGLTLLLFSGCGMITIPLRYESTGQPQAQVGRGLQVRLEVTDTRAKKILFRDSMGEGTEAGMGSLFRLPEPTAAVLERTLMQTLQACGYEVREDADMVCAVNIERFMVLVSNSHSPIGYCTDVALDVRVRRGQEELARKVVFEQQKDNASPFVPMQSMIEPLLIRSFSRAAERVAGATELAEGVRRGLARDEPVVWAKVQGEGTPEAYTEYLRKYPDGAHAGDARSWLDEAAWSEAKKAGTVEGYNGYLAAHGSGAHASEARERMDILVWAKVQGEGTGEAYAEYLKRYPNGAHAGDARSWLDEAAWSEAKKAGTVEGYRGYLATPGSGAHASEAREQLRRLDQLDWLRAESTRTVAGYKEYLERHPETERYELLYAQLKVLGEGEANAEMRSWAATTVEAYATDQSGRDLAGAVE